MSGCFGLIMRLITDAVLVRAAGKFADWLFKRDWRKLFKR